MINILLPHGSKRRSYIKNTIDRIKRKRLYEFHKLQYNNYRQEYYRTSNRLTVGDTDRPKISVVVPCYNTPHRYLRELVDSVFAQGYDNWELVLIDASNDIEYTRTIEEIATSDNRIVYKKIKNQGIAVNTNAGIDIATGGYIAFLDHDDTLDPDALAENARVIMDHNPDLIYSDEDKVSDDGLVYFEPHFKPDFSLPTLRCVNYITHFVVVKRSLVDVIGGVEVGYDGAQDYNFLLNVVDKTDKIFHIQKVLYHWRQAVNSTASNFANKKHVTDAGEKALTNHYDRRKIKATAIAIKNRPGYYETHYHLSKANRAVVVDVDSTSSKISELVIREFRKHPDIKKYAIEVLELSIDDPKLQTFDEVIYVNQIIFPTNHKDHSIEALFGLLDSGSDYATIKKVSRGMIVDYGLVDDGGTQVPLFYGINPTHPQYFGSSEWNRQVSGLKSGLIATKRKNFNALGKKIISDGELVVLGQYEYIKLSDPSVRLRENTSKNNYFNPNLSFEVYPRLIVEEIIKDKIEIKK